MTHEGITPAPQMAESTPDWRQQLNPDVLQLAADPNAITDPQAKYHALVEAGRLSGGDRVILSDEKGQPRWGEEMSAPGSVFSFDGHIRGEVDHAPEDPADVHAAGLDMSAAANQLRGNTTHVIVETDDGQQLMIRRTNETNAAADQTFDIASTSKGNRRGIDSSALKHVVAVVGEPLVLGIDPGTGKHLRTRGSITKITTINMNDDPVAANHPRLSKPEFHRDTVQQFGEAMKVSRKQEVAQEAGEVAVEHMIPPLESPSDSQAATSNEAILDAADINPYERFTGDQLEQIRDNIADSFVEGIRQYDRAAIARSTANLAAVQREFETRLLVPQPARPHGTVEGSVTYTTEPDPVIVRTIAEKLQTIDGGFTIVNALRNSLKMPDKADTEAYLRYLDRFTVLDAVSKQVRALNGSEFYNTQNPYATKTNEELSTLVDQFKSTIQSLEAQGQGTANFRQQLVQVGQVIQSRKA